MKRLTELEREMLRLVDEGASRHEICDQLGIDGLEYLSTLDELTQKIEIAVTTNEVEVDQVRTFERTRRAMVQAQLYASEARFHALIEIIPRAIMVVDGRSGNILQANLLSEKLFGYPLDELIGLNVDLLLPQEQRDLHVKQRLGFLRSIRKREIGYHPPIFALRKDGSQMEVIVGLISTTATEDVMVVCSLVEGSAP